MIDDDVRLADSADDTLQTTASCDKRLFPFCNVWVEKRYNSVGGQGVYV